MYWRIPVWMWLRPATVAAIAFLSISVPARADFFPVLDFSGGTTAPAGAPLTLGDKFMVGALPFTVTAVGLWVGTTPDGQTVRIYQDGTTVNLLSQSILSTDPTNGSGKYQYDNLVVPLVLSANTTYDIVVDITNGANVAHIEGTASSSDSDITYTQGLLVLGSGAFPTTDRDGAGPYFGPTFEGTTAPGSVPEPSAFALFSTVVASGFLARKRRFAKALRS